MASQSQTQELTVPPFDLSKLSFVVGTHIAGAIGIVLWAMGTITVSSATLWLAFGTFAFSSTAITAGYHRLYSHRTYQAAWILRFYYLIGGAMALQGSALQWAAQHRDHHTFCDGPKDPYNINLGFWHAHLGWVVRQTDPDYGRVKDLSVERMNRWQHDYYGTVAFVTSFIWPAAIASLWGEFWSALLVAGAIRLVIQWHMTFCVNSVAHYWGSQKYSQNHTARGSWWLAFLVWGEMDHNYHHTFPNDFRTGTRWYDFDPGKWFISVAALLGLAKDVKKTDKERIERVTLAQTADD